MDVILDCDCTVADFVGAICKIAGETDRNRATSFDWFMKDYDQETRDRIKNRMISPEWWDEFNVIKDANKGVAWLRGQGHSLIWVTVPFQHCKGWLDARREWLDRNFNFKKHDEPLITVSNATKYHIKADVIIDDTPEVVDDYSVHHPKAICLTFGSEINRNLNRELVTWEQIMSMRELWYGQHYRKGL